MYTRVKCVGDKAGACNTVVRVKPRLINVCGRLNCSFIIAYAMLTTFTIVRCNSISFFSIPSKHKNKVNHRNVLLGNYN